MQGERSVSVWKSLLWVHALALSPDQNRDTLLKFCHMCQKAKRSALARRTLYTCGAPEPVPTTPRKIGEAANAPAIAELDGGANGAHADGNGLSAARSRKSSSLSWEAHLADVPLQVQYAYACHLWESDEAT